MSNWQRKEIPMKKEITSEEKEALEREWEEEIEALKNS